MKDKYKELKLKGDKKEFQEWFLNYKPDDLKNKGEKISKPKTSKTTTSKTKKSKTTTSKSTTRKAKKSKSKTKKAKKSKLFNIY